jgi:hypothetical protein
MYSKTNQPIAQIHNSISFSHGAASLIQTVILDLPDYCHSVLVAVPIVSGFADQVLQSPLIAPQVCKRSRT